MYINIYIYIYKTYAPTCYPTSLVNDKPSHVVVVVVVVVGQNSPTAQLILPSFSPLNNG